MRRLKSSSFSVYIWNQKGLVTCSATSSIEQIDMVESVKGTPNFSAARAALISPSALCMPVSPTGASATGIATSCPIIDERVPRPVMSTAMRWRNRICAKSAAFSRKVCSVQLPVSA